MIHLVKANHNPTWARKTAYKRFNIDGGTWGFKPPHISKNNFQWLSDLLSVFLEEKTYLPQSPRLVSIYIKIPFSANNITLYYKICQPGEADVTSSIPTSPHPEHNSKHFQPFPHTFKVCSAGLLQRWTYTWGVFISEFQGKFNAVINLCPTLIQIQQD